ncbi:hypothetical protein [Sphingomonas sp. 3P27F8]|uniref:hypothetical protein n=1 Tax=Sphingomonas sp. 3P27F8 TaxID=2502213 RepID=UPI0010F50311|nr:hypothetical protein [Sphingomonas sp. 3P27F8]
MRDTPPLDLVYAAVFGEPPGTVVGAVLGRIERYLLGNATQSTALMLCILVRPLDLHVQATTSATRQMHDARLLLESEVNALRSNDALIIGQLRAAMVEMMADNGRLRRELLALKVAEQGYQRAKILCIAAAAMMALILATLVTLSFNNV